jgi:hypothetical protein
MCFRILPKIIPCTKFCPLLDHFRLRYAIIVQLSTFRKTRPRPPVVIRFAHIRLNCRSELVRSPDPMLPNTITAIGKQNKRGRESNERLSSSSTRNTRQANRHEPAGTAAAGCQTAEESSSRGHSRLGSLHTARLCRSSRIGMLQ